MVMAIIILVLMVMEMAIILKVMVVMSGNHICNYFCLFFSGREMCISNNLDFEPYFYRCKIQRFTFSNWTLSKTVKLMQWYFTQLTVTLLHCSKVLEKFKSLSSGLCTIFCKWDHCVGSTSGFATSATNTVVEFAKNSAKTTRKVTKICSKTLL